MRITSVVLIGGILGLAGPSLAWADEPAAFHLDSAALADQVGRAAQQLEDLAQATARLAQRPTVNCGLTLVPPDPKLDARIRKAAPAGVRPSMRTVTPPMCRAEATTRFTVPTTPRR